MTKELTKEEARRAAEVMMAWSNGASILKRTPAGEVTEVEKPPWNWGDDEYFIKPVLTYRAWELREVPIGKIVCRKEEVENPYRGLIVSAIERSMGPYRKVLIGIGNNSVSELADRVLEEWVMEDGSPCGVAKLEEL